MTWTARKSIHGRHQLVVTMAKLTMANMDTDMAKLTMAMWIQTCGVPDKLYNWHDYFGTEVGNNQQVIDSQIHYKLTDPMHEAFSTRGSGMPQCRPKGFRFYAKRRELQHYDVHEFVPLL